MTLLNTQDATPQAPPGTAPPPTGDGGTPPQDTGPEWLNAIEDENLRKDPGLTKFKSAHELAVSYKSLEGKLGTDPISMPKREDPPERWDEFWNKVGRPEKPEEYQFEPIEGYDAPENITNQFKTGYHKLGLTGEQANAVHKLQAELLLNAVNDVEQQQAAKIKDNETQLRKEWGIEYDHRIKMARKVALLHGGPEFLKMLESNDALGSDPGMLRFFWTVGARTSEDVLKGVTGDEPPAPQKKSRAELETMMQDPRYGGIGNEHKLDHNYRGMINKLWEDLYKDEHGRPRQQVVAATDRSEYPTS
jgi:hypothetical protein